MTVDARSFGIAEPRAVNDIRLADFFWASWLEGTGTPGMQQHGCPHAIKPPPSQAPSSAPVALHKPSLSLVLLHVLDRSSSTTVQYLDIRFLQLMHSCRWTPPLFVRSALIHCGYYSCLRSRLTHEASSLLLPSFTPGAVRNELLSFLASIPSPSFHCTPALLPVDIPLQRNTTSTRRIPEASQLFRKHTNTSEQQYHQSGAGRSLQLYIHFHKTATSMSTNATVTNSTMASNATKVANQGVLQGEDPSKYNPADPITLFIIQVRDRRRTPDHCRRAC